MKQAQGNDSHFAIRNRLIKTWSTMSMQNFMADPNFASKMVKSGIYLSYHESQNHDSSVAPFQMICQMASWLVAQTSTSYCDRLCG